VHLEEDAGKLLHEGFPDSGRKAYIDYNRAGVPLIEIVTEPDLRSAADAAGCFSWIRTLLVWLGVNDGNMEGSLRWAGAPLGAATLGIKTESGCLVSPEPSTTKSAANRVDAGYGRPETRPSTRTADHGRCAREEAHDYRFS
jgi:aspartyl-tRNA(Asn)/glutamyl-tRNA(Gln) amidotransferase subunit B